MARVRGWCSLGIVFAGFLSCMSHAEGFLPNDFDNQSQNSSESSGWAPTIKRSPVVIPGTGALIGAPPKGVSVSQEKGEITLNFSDADVTEVVQAVLGDALGLNYVLSPKVQGNLTIRTSRPLARADVLSIFDAALRVQGATIVKTDNVYQVVPISEAPASAAAPMVRAKPFGRSPGYGIEVVKLRYVSAAQMEPVLKSAGPQDSILYVDTVRNLLLLGGTPDVRSALTDMISIFDVDYMRGMSFALIPLEYSDANEVVNDLERIFNLNSSHTSDKDKDKEKSNDKQNLPAGGPIRFLPIARLNAIIIVSSDLAYINHAQEWIKRLDQRDEAGQRIYVYSVQNGRANDIALVLGQIFGAQTQAPSEKGQIAPGQQPVQIESTLKSIQSTLTGSGAAVSSGQLSMAPPAVTSATTGYQTGTTQPAVVQFTGESAVRIVPDPAINALVIYATPPDYKKILAALKNIDVAPLQVLIEATVAEVTLDHSHNFGLQWFLNGVSGSVDFTGENILKTIGGAATGGAAAFSYAASTQNAQVVLQALAQNTDVKILSSPHIMVVDNQTARIQVGDQVPVLTSQAVSTLTPGAPIVNSVQYVDSGVVLEVTPHINNSGLVTLDIVQQISTPTKTQSSGIDSPTIQQRMITSSVAVQSGETVTLGGLIADRETKSGQGLPALRQIPVVGYIFGVRGKETSRTEIMVLLTPRVVRDRQDMRDLTYEMGTRMRSIVPLGEKIQ